MKIIKLRIQNYKNIQDLTIDFTDGLNYAAFVGLNGSGKSNIIEAISIIFNYLYLDRVKKTIFDFEISYQINERLHLYRTKKQIISSHQITKISGGDSLSNYGMEFPTNIIACYSGEDIRLYEDVYQKNYQYYFDSLKRNGGFALPQMVYIDKSCWVLATIALLVSENPSCRNFVEKISKDINLDDVYITFDVHISKSTKQNIVSDFVKRIFSTLDSKNRLYITTLSSLDLGAGYLSKNVKELFYYFFTAIVTKPIKDADELITDLQLHGINLNVLSEGEKKQILMTFINEILADENSLVLLDEPDAHWHIERQKELANTIKSQKHFTILTTHSPILSTLLEINSIKMLENNSGNISLCPTDKLQTVNKLSNGMLSVQEQNVLFADNEIVPLLVEGKGDVDYINKAISLFETDYQNLKKLFIMPFGGATNAEYYVREFNKIFPATRKFIVLFDRDSAGCESGLNKLAPDSVGKGGKRDTTKYYVVNSNMYCLMLPKLDGFSEDDFLIEDYFKKEHITQSIHKIIGEYKSVNKVPRDIRESLKSHLSKSDKMQAYTKSDLEGFDTLLKLLNEILGVSVSGSANIGSTDIQGNNVAVSSLNVIEIFKEYKPRGQAHTFSFTARYSKISGEVSELKKDSIELEIGRKYKSPNQAMIAARESVNVNNGPKAGVYWKYKDENGTERLLDNLPEFKKSSKQID